MSTPHSFFFVLHWV